MDGTPFPFTSRIAFDRFSTVQQIRWYLDEVTWSDGDTVQLRIAEQVAGTPVTADLSSYDPVEGKGGHLHYRFDLRLSQPVWIPFHHMRDHAFDVTNGTVVRAKRVSHKPRYHEHEGRWRKFSDHWLLEVKPTAPGTAVTVALARKPCDAQGALCAADGGLLGNSPSLELGTPGAPLSVSIAAAPEGDGHIPFVITLSRATDGVVEVDFETTTEGTATEGVDFQAGEHLVVFEPQETSVTLGVGIHEDQIEDDGETVTVKLTGARVVQFDRVRRRETTHGLTITDPMATGTINNTAPQRLAAPLTAVLEGVPSAHDGAGAFTFELRFSEEVGLSYVTVRDALFAVTGGRVTGARRLARPSNRHWEVTVAPDSGAEVGISLAPGRACGEPGAVCTADGRALSNGVATVVRGPAALAVADAQAREGEDETIDFAVTLSRAASGPVTVAYATADGSATAGSDYTAVSGTLTFAAGETGKTVSVPVLDDAIDEGEETLTLRLSNASGARIATATATGTIVNSDPLQMMWLSRFGRTVAGQVVDAVTGRLSGPPGGSRVTLGGRSIDLLARSAGTGDARRTLAGALGAQRTAEDDETLAGPGAWPPAQAGSWEDPEAGHGSARGMTGRELLLGSSFHLAPGGGEAGGPALAAWGRVAVGGFDAQAPADNGTVRLDGEVTTGILGADAAWERWLAGVAVSVSEGEGTFDQPGVDSGTIESTLTSVTPYVRYEVSERLSAWGLLGYGTGDMTMTQAARGARAGTVTRTDLSMRLGAVGERGALLKAAQTGGVELALRGDSVPGADGVGEGGEHGRHEGRGESPAAGARGQPGVRAGRGCGADAGARAGSAARRRRRGDGHRGRGGRAYPLCRCGLGPDGGGERAHPSSRTRTPATRSGARAPRCASNPGASAGAASR